MAFLTEACALVRTGRLVGTAPDRRGRGGNIVDIEFWRAQVRLSANSALRPLLLYHDPAAPGCMLESIW
ncbi:hypothetical protein [Paenarthrobacter nitroguajacolicus]|uniref:hypothetical protein n=1 Tax=Paenarthrobacter nitroguajacolicus TaxID=211146 RepID=UPI001FCBBBE5|nr:hypothetical protein [Paenarthrobacter nitroguajacolicus]